MAEKQINIPIKTTVDAADLGLLEGSLAALRKELAQAKKDFESAASGSDAWKEAAARVVDLNTRVLAGLQPLREIAEANERTAEAQRQLTAAISAGVNPWTTASAKYREAQAALNAQTQAAKEAEAASRRLTQTKQAEAAASRSDAVASAQRQMLADMRESEAATKRLASRLDELPPINAKVGKSSGDAGHAVLELSRAFEDAQYGIAGILNNIPGIITMFGGGAGLAGVISMAAVAASVLSKRLDSANFDGTWIGDLKTAITEMVDGMTEEERRLRDLAESPLSWIKNSEEAFAAQESAAERALNKEIELLTLRRDLIKETIDLRAAEAAHQAKLNKINRIDRPRGSDEWAKDEMAAAEDDFTAKEAARIAAVKKAEVEKKAADEDARKAETAAAAQRERVKGLKTRELKTKQAAASSIPTEFDDQLSLMESYAAGGSNAELDAQIKDLRDKQRAKRESMMVPADLPFAAPGETIKGAEAKAEEMALKAQELRLKKAREEQEFAAAQEASRKAREINQAEFKDAQGDVQSEVFGKISKDQEEARKKADQQRQGKDREQGQVTTAETAPAPVPMQDQINAANAGLNNLAGSTGDAEAKLKLQAMYAALNDGKGETAKELATIQQMLSDMGTTDSERRASLNATLRQLEGLQRDGSAMQAALSGALSGLVQNQQDLVAYVRGLQPQIDQIRTQINTR